MIEDFGNAYFNSDGAEELIDVDDLRMLWIIDSDGIKEWGFP